MALIIFFIVFLALAVAAPWLGTDSRDLSATRRPYTYPADPDDSTAEIGHRLG